MIKSTKLFFASLTLVALAACSGGSGSGGGGTIGGGSGGGGTIGGGSGGGGTIGGGSGPASGSIADLTAFAQQGTQSVNERGVAVSRNTYGAGADRQTVALSGTDQVGLLTQTTGANPVQNHTIIGADENRSVNHRGYYVAETSGALRMRAGDATSAVTGDTAIGMNSATGEWQLGSTVFDGNGTRGAYIGIDGGSVRGNTMVFDAANSKMSEITPTGVLSSSERAGATAVFGRGGENVFGKVNGQNAGTGFMVDLGFAGSEFSE